MGSLGPAQGPSGDWGFPLQAWIGVKGLGGTCCLESTFVMLRSLHLCAHLAQTPPHLPWLPTESALHNWLEEPAAWVPALPLPQQPCPLGTEARALSRPALPQ